MWDEASPVLIQMGQAADFASFDAFRGAVKARPCTYDANGTLTYTSLAGDVYRITRNSFAQPTVNGGGSTDPAKTYSSPYLLGYHGSNSIELSYAGRPSLFLDFTL